MMMMAVFLSRSRKVSFVEEDFGVFAEFLELAIDCGSEVKDKERLFRVFPTTGRDTNHHIMGI